MAMRDHRAGDLSLLRRLNSLAVLRFLRSGPASVTEIASQVGLSRTATKGVLDDLDDRGWVTADYEPGAQATTTKMGRPSKPYRFRAEAGHVIGVDIGTHKILGVLTDLNGGIQASERIQLNSRVSAAGRLSALDDTIAAVLADAHCSPADLWRISVGMSGIIRDNHIRLVHAFPGWTGLDLVGHVTEKFGCPALLENDGGAAVLAEKRIGAAQPYDDVLLLLAGTRTGTSLLLGGKIYRGFRGMAGEIGALEHVRWREATAIIEGMAEHGIKPDRQSVFAAAQAGHLAALAAADRYAEILATGLATMVQAIDPQLVVVSGGIAGAGDALLTPLRRHLNTLCLEAPPIVMSTLGDESVAIGAALIAIDHIDADLADRTDNSAEFPSTSDF